MGIFRGAAMRVTVAGTVAALGLTAAASPAVAAGTETWRVASVVNQAGGRGWMDAVVATGPANAWAFGGSFADDGQDAPLARHWDGRSWKKAVLPAGLERPVTTARATGPRDVWAFAGGDQGGEGYAIRWDGHRWTVMKRWPEGEIISDAAVLTPRDVWVFGNSRIGPAVGTWHYDGRTWTQVETPVGQLAKASVVSADDAWAIGTTPPGYGDDLVARWDGRTWRRVTVPGLPPQEETHWVHFAGVYARSSHDVWIVGDEYRQNGDDSTETPFVLHFNGHAWRRYDTPATANGVLYDVAPDGRGGIWVTPSTDEPYDHAELLHFADGRWTQVRPRRPDGTAVQVRDIATVPRTRSAWAVGEIFPLDRATSDGAIWVNGPLPR